VPGVTLLKLVGTGAIIAGVVALNIGRATH
jgi:hypothetical protein